MPHRPILLVLGAAAPSAGGEGQEQPAKQLYVRYRVVKTIDGRELPRAHGERTMPVWGQILSEELGSGTKRRLPIERRVQGRILSIAKYLRTIQVK